jgi:hypothetical protein
MMPVGEVQGRLLCGGGLPVDTGDALQVVLVIPNLPAPSLIGREGFRWKPYRWIG